MGLTSSTALKKRHNKTSDDAKFQGTILGKPSDVGDLEIEGGGEVKTIEDWMFLRNGGSWQPQDLPSKTAVNGATDDHEHNSNAGSPSSGLSSVGDRVEESRIEEPSLPPESTTVIKKEKDDTKAGADDDAMDLT